MFNRALEVKMVKPNKTDASGNTEIVIDAQEIGTQVERAIFAIGTVLVSKKVLDTVCEVVLIAAKSKLS